MATAAALAAIPAPEKYDRRNESEHREAVMRELAQAYRRDGNLIIPFGKSLGFTSPSGQVVKLSIDGDGNFTFSLDDGSSTALGSAASVTAEAAARIAADSAEASTRSTADATLTTALGVTNASVTVNADAIAGINDTAAFFDVTVAASGSTQAVARLDAGAGGSRINLEADQFHVSYNSGGSRKKALSVIGANVTMYGDLDVGGSIFVGAARLKVALSPIVILAVDGAAIEWAGGDNIGNIPSYTFDISNLAALASGEAYNVSLSGVTATGATVSAKITTPGTTASVTSSTASAGGGGNPDRIVDKTDAADASDATYNFRVQGNVLVTSNYESELTSYLNSGSCLLTTWFYHGAAWHAGPTLEVTFSDAGIPFLTATDQSGLHSFDVTLPVSYGAAVGGGSGGQYEFGVSYSSGGSLSGFPSVQWLKRTDSGTRTASPGGEQLKIIAYPVNA